MLETTVTVEGQTTLPQDVRRELEIEVADDVGTAAFQYRDGGFGFADLMIVAAMRRADGISLVTFDRKAAQIHRLEFLKA